MLGFGSSCVTTPLSRMSQKGGGVMLCGSKSFQWCLRFFRERFWGPFVVFGYLLLARVLIWFTLISSQEGCTLALSNNIIQEE
jgi:hypothetical protein